MPSTSLSGWTLTNIGPLTTTFTPPPSCSNPNQIMYATKATPEIFFMSNCDANWGDCLPSTSAQESTTSEAPINTSVLGYRSPGIVCPSGWKTVGVAARGPDDASPTLSGAFESLASAVATKTGYGGDPLYQLVLASALDKGETAVECCPSSMTAHVQAACYSPLPSFTSTQACQAILPEEDISWVPNPYTTNGSTVMRGSNIITGTLPPRTRTIPLTGSTGGAAYSAFSAAPAVFMVHGSSVGGASATSTSTGNTAAATTTTANMAPRVGVVTTTAWGDVGVLAGFVTVATSVGAVMVLL